MAVDAKTVINIALAEAGYLEKASNSNLDDKTANAGSGNWTKYARDLDNITGFYNGKKNGYAWCDIFVDWCFVKAYGVATAKKLLCQPDYSGGAGCTYSAQYYRNKGQWFTSPKVGDQIFFGNAAESYHTGLVYAVDNSNVYTIEGNTSGASGVVANGGGVCKKQYSRSYSKIYGYGRPAYETNTETVSSGTAQPTKVTPTKTCQVTMTQLQKGSEGIQVVLMQTALIKQGFDVGIDGADGDFGNKTLTALKLFQASKKLTADGICGANTWKALVN